MTVFQQKWITQRKGKLHFIEVVAEYNSYTKRSHRNQDFGGKKKHPKTSCHWQGMNQLPPPKPANPRHPSTELPITNHSYESANEREHTMITEEHTITTNQHRRRDLSTERLLEKTLETIKFSADFIS